MSDQANRSIPFFFSVQDSGGDSTEQPTVKDGSAEDQKEIVPKRLPTVNKAGVL